MKSGARPALSFANAVICLAAQIWEWLERDQQAVKCLGVGCYGRVTNEAVQGYIGWSSSEVREARNKIAYDSRLRLMARRHLALKVFNNISTNCVCTSWMKCLQRLHWKFIFFGDLVHDDNAQKWARVIDNTGYTNRRQRQGRLPGAYI